MWSRSGVDSDSVVNARQQLSVIMSWWAGSLARASDAAAADEAGLAVSELALLEEEEEEEEEEAVPLLEEEEEAEEAEEGLLIAARAGYRCNRDWETLPVCKTCSNSSISVIDCESWMICCTHKRNNTTQTQTQTQTKE